MKKELRELFLEYDDCHRHPVNRLTHKIGIPLIFFNAIAMLDWLKLPVTELSGGIGSISLAHVGVALCALWYLRMSFWLGAIVVAGLVAMLITGPYFSVTEVLLAGLFGWVIQMAGHVHWEKKAPSFTRNGVQALVGPIYFVATAIRAWPAPEWRSTTPLKASGETQ